jgi:hypothetical protein
MQVCVAICIAWLHTTQLIEDIARHVTAATAPGCTAAVLVQQHSLTLEVPESKTSNCSYSYVACAVLLNKSGNCIRPFAVTI